MDDGMNSRPEPTRVPEDVLLYGALCQALLDYTLSLILGADGISGQIIETHFVSRAPRDKKVKVLRVLLRQYCPDVADAPPYDTLGGSSLTTETGSRTRNLTTAIGTTVSGGGTAATSASTSPKRSWPLSWIAV